MKTLQEFIQEKLKVTKKHTDPTHISIEQLNILFFYIACYLKEDDLRNDGDYILWGEMERYGKYRIDFYDDKNKWISEYGCTDSENNEDMAEKMNALGDVSVKLFGEFIDWTLDSEKSENTFLKIAAYIIEYIEKYDTAEIDLYKIDKIDKKFNKLHLMWTDYEELMDDLKEYDEHIHELINELYIKAKDLLE